MPAVLVASTAGDVFGVLVAAHVICAVVGFGALLLSGIYGFSNRRPAGPEAIEEARRYFRSPGRIELLVLPVPFLGLAALLVQPHGRGPGQLWDLAASAIWLVAAVVLFGVVRPAERSIRAALRLGAATPASGEGDIDLARLGESARRLGWAGLTTDMAFFLALVLMIFQPH
jgi:hypothetical protein